MSTDLDENSDNDSLIIENRLPNTNNIIRGQNNAYAVGKRISTGRYGAVYEVLRRNDGKRFAAKLEVCDVKSNALNMDYIVYKASTKLKLSHLTELIDRGKIEGHFKFLVLKLLGDNLYKLRQQFVGYRFSAPTALRLAIEMVNALEQLHSLGFIHRDVKPSNFAVHNVNGRTNIYLIDFGLSRQFRSLSTGELKPPRQKAHFRGTPRYASLAAHQEQEQSRKDDLESWYYVVIELMAGELPWNCYQNSEKKLIQKEKEKIRTHEDALKLLKNCPSTEFLRLMKYLDNLLYQNQPDYNFVRQQIQLAMKNNDINPKEAYDWEESDEIS